LWIVLDWFAAHVSLPIPAMDHAGRAKPFFPNNFLLFGRDDLAIIALFAPAEDVRVSGAGGGMIERQRREGRRPGIKK